MNARFVEKTILVSVMGLVVCLAMSSHQPEPEWVGYRSTMRELAHMVRTMRNRALARQRTVQLRVDASRGAFQLTSIQDESQAYETLERTLWLPQGLEVSEAPAELTALPSGQLLLPAPIIVDAPSYSRLFRLTADEKTGAVQLHEEPAM